MKTNYITIRKIDLVSKNWTFLMNIWHRNIEDHLLITKHFTASLVSATFCCHRRHTASSPELAHLFRLAWTKNVPTLELWNWVHLDLFLQTVWLELWSQKTPWATRCLSSTWFNCVCVCMWVSEGVWERGREREALLGQQHTHVNTTSRSARKIKVISVHCMTSK